MIMARFSKYINISKECEYKKKTLGLNIIESWQIIINS